MDAPASSASIERDSLRASTGWRRQIQFVAVAVMSILLLLAPCRGEEVPEWEILKTIRIAGEWDWPNTPNLYQQILDKVESGTLVDAQGKPPVERPQCGIAWVTTNIPADATGKVHFSRPSIYEAFAAASEARGEKIVPSTFGLIIVPKETRERSLEAVVMCRSKSASEVLQAPIDFNIKVVDTPLSQSNTIVGMLNGVLRRNLLQIARRRLGERVEIKMAPEFQIDTQKKPMAARMVNLRGFWSMRDLLYAFCTVGGYEVVERLPGELIVQLIPVP